MMKIRVGNLWVCSLQNYFITFLFILLSHSLLVQCQIIRKSVELPVKNYLSSPRTSRDNWNGRDQLYLQRDNSDSVRNFDHLPPHTPASALVFSGVINDFINVGSTNPPPLFLTPTIVYNGRSDRNSFPPTATSTKADYGFNNKNNIPLNINLQLPTSSSPTKVLKSDQNQNKNGISLVSSTPSTKNNINRGSYRMGQKHPVLSTPSPSLKDNNDAVFGYFNKLPASSMSSREDKVDQMVESINDLAQYSNIVPHSEFASHSYEKDTQSRQTPSRNSYNTRNSFPKHKLSQKYPINSKLRYINNPSEEDSSLPYGKDIVRSRENYSHSGESNDYENSSGRGEMDYSQEQQKPHSGQYSDYRDQSNESNEYESPPERPLYNQKQRGSAEYYKHSNEYYDYESQPYSKERPVNNTVRQPYKLEDKQPYNQQTDRNFKPHQSSNNGNSPLTSQETPSKSKLERHRLPTIPPTIGVIGWKSNKEPETQWKPNEAPMNIPSQYIRDNSKENAYNNKVRPTETAGHPYKQNERPSQNQEVQEEGEEEEDEESEEEEEGEDGEEEEEEEESEGEELEDEEKEPHNPPSKYENSSDSYKKPKYYPQYRDESNKPYHSSDYYEEEEPLPPGPPYLPPSNLKGDPRTNGYLPFPSSGAKPHNRVENGDQEPWKPIVPSPTVASQNFDDYKANEKYKSEIDRWLFEGGSVFDFPKEKNFQGWTRLDSEKIKINLGEAESSGEFLKTKEKSTDPNNKKLHDLKKKPTESERNESKDLPVEHRYNHSGNEHTVKERKTSRTSTKEKPSGINYQSHSQSQDVDENDERNHVSEHEFPREVPTRVRYPGSGIWAKPKPGTGVDLGFVPKKLYTQTRKYNTVTHLPQEAALVDASTPEEKINAPRLRETISHKKTQEVYEEEGYEDSGYDHGGYKKHGQHETHILSQGQYSNPDIVWGSKSNGRSLFGQGNRTPAPFSKKTVEPSSSFKPISGRHKYSSRLQSSVAPRVSFEVEDGYPVDSPSKERKSRDLSSFGQEDVGGEVFTHSTASLREIEDQISSLSGSRSDVQTTTRQPHKESTSNSGRKYKEIIRTTSHSQEENGENKKDRALRVNLKQDELNIRHPFLPRDGNGDVHIDYVQSRTRVEPETSQRKYRYEDELIEVTERPQTTTTPKVTTAKSTTTTTEYTPEDPSKVLKRLKGNVFLSSVFPTLESLEDKIDQHSDSPTTTTPKVTTYRGKPTSTTEETSSPETPEETLDRLKSNPFLSSILTSSTQATEEKQRQPKRGIRIKHVVVNPRDSNIMSDSSVKHVEKLTLAQYSGPSHGLMYTQVPTRTKQRIFTLAKHLNDEGVEAKHSVVRRSVNSESEKQDESTQPTKETTTDNPVDVKKYPFYYSPASVSFPMLSPMRYALNPANIPNKTSNGMEFYESRDRKVRCYEPTPPKDIVPSREKNGDWNKNPRPEKQRLGKLGDQIDCLKVKYFGEDPLDNPLFKEENVSIPNFKPPSPKDSLGFYYDVVKNIKSFPESTGKLSTRSNKEKEVFRSGSSVHEPLFINPHKENNNKTSDKSKMTKYIYSSTYRNATKANNTEAAASKLSTKLSSVKNKTIFSTLPTNTTEPNQNIIKLNLPDNESQEFSVFPTTQEVQTGFVPIIPVMLRPPKDVTVSFKSKGTTNHPKIKTAKENPAPYNINIKIVPKGTVGYLQSHNPFHIQDLAASMLGGETMESVKPVFIPDSASSAARTITKVNKQPTTVTYLTINPDGDLLHKHIRTFVPVPSRTPSTTGPHPKYNLEANDQRNWRNLYHKDYERNKPTYRVKRSDENDKYINSKESLELKNYLLQKYKDILSKQTTETSTEQSTSERPSTRAPTSTLRTFPVRSQRPYSSRYSTISTVREIVGTEGSTEKGELPTKRNPSVIRPKLRFPKLNMRTRGSTDGDEAKISSLQEPVHVKTQTTTTTTSPPSTTTRMYKPRMVHRRKEYGRPVEKVTDIFAVLKRQPISRTELSTTEPTTEKIKSPDPLPTNRIRRPMPHGFERSAERRSSQDKTTRRQGSPHIYNQERSLDISENPDIRTPISRSSRNTPEGTNNEMLVYMVNPTTGLGEWKVVPVTMTLAVSRVDTRLNGNANSFQNQNNKRTVARRRKLRPEPTYEYYKSKYIPKEYNVQEENTPDTNKENDYTTVIPATNHWNRISQNPSRFFQKEVNHRRDDEETTPMNLEAASQTMVPEKSNTRDSALTKINPKIIMEPYKRKYFYVKI